MLDVYSRYIVGWMIAHRESASLADTFIRRGGRSNAGATFAMKRAISSFTCACGFSPTFK